MGAEGGVGEVEVGLEVQCGKLGGGHGGEVYEARNWRGSAG